jgi:hypothetical protein
VTKYLIIAALVSIAFVLIYTRIRPYLKLFQKVAQSLHVVTDLNATTAQTKNTPSKNKLVRCERCGTWIPAVRALSLNAGLATFCSTECMSQETGAKERKMAG